jgi:hypothetical protein
MKRGVEGLGKEKVNEKSRGITRRKVKTKSISLDYKQTDNLII